MNEPRRTAAGNAARASTAPRGKFYVGSAAVLLLIVIVGFAPTFYLRAAFGGPEFSWRGGVHELSWRVFVHGLIFTSWFLAFALQAALVAARRTALHRALGWAGAAIGLAVIISGGLATPYRMAELAAQGRALGRIGLPRFSCGRILLTSLRSPSCSRRRLGCGAGRTRTTPDAARVDQHYPTRSGRILRWPVFAAPPLEVLMLSVAAPFALVGALIVYDFLSRKSLHPPPWRARPYLAG